MLNYKVTLLQLKSALADILSQQGAKAPQRVRFFRGQMQTIISRALADLDIKPVPSRRCFALIGRHVAPQKSCAAIQEPSGTKNLREGSQKHESGVQARALSLEMLITAGCLSLPTWQRCCRSVIL